MGHHHSFGALIEHLLCAGPCVGVETMSGTFRAPFSCSGGCPTLLSRPRALVKAACLASGRFRLPATCCLSEECAGTPVGCVVEEDVFPPGLVRGMGTFPHLK